MVLFFKEFVVKDIVWVYIDIVGLVWSDKGKGVNFVGVIGYGVCILVNWVLV